MGCEIYPNPDRLIYDVFIPRKTIDILLVVPRDNNPKAYSDIKPETIYEKYLQILTNYGEESLDDLSIADYTLSKNNIQITPAFERQSSHRAPSIGIWSVDKFPVTEISLFSHKNVAEKKHGQDWVDINEEEQIMIEIIDQNSNIDLSLYLKLQGWYYDKRISAAPILVKRENGSYQPRPEELEHMMKLTNFLERSYKRSTSSAQRL